jgi:uncharacterized repeat protein (TIGR01451 family)
VLSWIVSGIGGTARFLPIVALLAASVGAVPAFAVGNSASSPGPLTISQSTSGPPTVGLPVTFTITVTNTTSGQASDVFLGDTLPIGARLTGALPNPNRCAKGGASGSQAFACLVGTLGASGSGSESFSINFTIIPSASTLDNKAATTGFAGGSFVTNSVDLILGAAPAPTDVQITGSSSTGSPSAGSPFAYVFQVKNSGPQLASAVSFSDTLPAGERVLGAFSTSGTCTTSAGTVSCNLGDLAVGSSALIGVGVTAPTTAGTYVNSASVSSGVTDTNPANNTVSVTIQVK